MKRAMLLYCLLFPACNSDIEIGSYDSIEIDGGIGGVAGAVSVGGSGGTVPAAGGESGAGGQAGAPQGGSGGVSGQGGSAGTGGSSVIINPEATAMMVPTLNGSTMAGSVTFRRTTDINPASSPGIKLDGIFSPCAPEVYNVRIFDGTSCEDRGLYGELWDDPRGNHTPQMRCTSSGVLNSQHIEQGDRKWTLGDGSNTDIVGKILMIVSKNSDRTTYACGIIEID